MAKKERFWAFAWRWFKIVLEGSYWIAVYVGVYWVIFGEMPSQEYVIFGLVFLMVIHDIERRRKEKEREDGTMYIQVPTELLARTDAHSITMHIQREREGEEDHEDPGRRDPRQLQ